MSSSTKGLLDETKEQQGLLPVETASKPKSWTDSPLAKAWIVLLVHSAACVALALILLLVLDGYEAGDGSSPEVVEGKLLLRVGDITTLVSVALVILKIVVASWSTMMLWGCAHYLRASKPPPNDQLISFMLRWKLPPWFKELGETRPDVYGWLISICIIVVLLQSFTSPILTGAVNWNAAFTLSRNPVTVSSIDETAGVSGWYWYNRQGYFDKRANLRVAAGYANLAWSDPSTTSETGASLTGNGCRHVVNNDGLPPNSTLENAVLPCINIHGIDWYHSKDQASTEALEIIVSGDGLTIVDDSPSSYYGPGVTMVFDENELHPGASDRTEPPTPYMFSGSKTVALLIQRHDITEPRCTQLTDTKFGNADAWKYFMHYWGNDYHENCYIVGTIRFTAGVTTSRQARYISPRVVEDQTPIEEVEFAPNPWVQEALWLIPDLMTMLSVMNTSQLPTFDNVDGYVSDIVRQAYIGAWDMSSHSWDVEGPSYNAFPAMSRIRAEVSLARVLSWLVSCLLMTMSGMSVLMWVLQSKHLVMPGGKGKQEDKEKESGKNTIEILAAVLPMTDPNNGGGVV